MTSSGQNNFYACAKVARLFVARGQRRVCTGRTQICLDFALYEPLTSFSSMKWRANNAFCFCSTQIQWRWALTSIWRRSGERSNRTSSGSFCGSGAGSSGSLRRYTGRHAPPGLIRPVVWATRQSRGTSFIVCACAGEVGRGRFPKGLSAASPPTWVSTSSSSRGVFAPWQRWGRIPGVHYLEYVAGIWQ